MIEEQQTLNQEVLDKNREVKPAGTRVATVEDYSMPQDYVNREELELELRNIETTKALIKANLVENVDYGLIPYCGKKPSLFKPGAEKIVRIFHVSIQYEDKNPVFDMEKGNVSHSIVCSAYFNGNLVQQGVGSANCFEKKFYKSNVRDRLGMDNTILKMAKKRALVDVALQLGSLSNTFTQDVEDFKDVIREEHEKQEHKQVKENMRKELVKYITVPQAKRLFAIAGSDKEIVRSAMTLHGLPKTAKTVEIPVIMYKDICEVAQQMRDEKKLRETEPIIEHNEPEPMPQEEE